MGGEILLKEYLDLPVVQYSHSSGKAVRIISPAGQAHVTDSTVLPEKYEVEWVK